MGTDGTRFAYSSVIEMFPRYSESAKPERVAGFRVNREIVDFPAIFTLKMAVNRCVDVVPQFVVFNEHRVEKPFVNKTLYRIVNCCFGKRREAWMQARIDVFDRWMNPVFPQKAVNDHSRLRGSQSKGIEYADYFFVVHLFCNNYKVIIITK
jgi:hypothetical protein